MISKLLLLCLGLVVPLLGARLPYIIGGTPVKDAFKYPWQCSVQYNGAHRCQAAIISDVWLVTVAHCVDISPIDVSVRCGSVDRLNGGVVRGILEIIEHEDRNTGSGSFPNDIAVIKVDTLPLGQTVNPIPMWDSPDDPAGHTDCYTMGWGYTTKSFREFPEFLQEAHVSVYTNEECKKFWSNSVNYGHVCYGDSENGRGSCTGDSGSSLVCYDEGEYKLVGVTTWGHGDCSTSFPFAASRITWFREWIAEKTGI